ncbi:MAG: hypothetical protein KatS3mg070_2330 [Meiothermus sp.]|uniref:hypothetical protein n=1 Tax=Meiothermus sp. TaxID=1955249 RepID=UPI0021DD6EEF|nr:hypothetical protein [Meiothermus sp.]GIW28967.1 MAG: hypothetical protein KatS3mg070_2330 [Meiothermus sp.]
MRKPILIGLVIAAMGTGLGLAQSSDRAFHVAPPGIPLPFAKPLAEGACKGLLDRAVKLVGAGPKDVGCYSFSRRKGDTLVNQLASGWALSLPATPVRLVAAYEVEGIFVASFVDTLNPSRGYYLAAGEVDPSTAQVVIWSISR